MDIKIIFLLFLFGLAVGSFLNVLGRRYSPAEGFFGNWSAGGRSRCPDCRKVLGWFELIPLLSFFIQKGRCKGCAGKISWHYPAVELLSGLTFSLLPLYFFQFYNPIFTSIPFWFFLLLGIWILIFLVIILLSLIDLRQYIIPNELNLILFILGISLIPILIIGSDSFAPFRDSFIKHYAFIFQFSESLIINKLIGLAFGVFFFGGLILSTKARAMGPGDAKLAAAFGVILGWPDIALATIVAFIFGGAWGLFFIIRRKKTMKDKLPFGPFFSFGFIVTVFAGFYLVENYLNLFGI